MIGTQADGASPLGNGGNGVLVNGASSNTVGGNAASAGNTIAFNQGAGVAVQSGTGDAVLTNSIFSNTGPGIRLLNGGNNNQPAPVFMSAVSSGGSTSVSGTLGGTSGATVTVQFFSNPRNFTEGKTFLGSTTVTIGGNGSASFSASLPVAVAAGQFVTATATDPANNTSSFSVAMAVTSGGGSGQADLSVTLVSPLRVAEGQPILFQFAIHNAGPGDAAAVVLTDALPAAALSTMAFMGQGTFSVSGGILTGNVGTVPAGVTATGTITFTADEGFLSDAVQVSSTTPDPNPANNVAGTHTLVTDPPLVAQGGFTVTAGPGATAQTLATFSDAAPGETSAALGAVIAWGDGSTSDVAVSPGQAAGSFTVAGSHAYAAPGTYTVTVSLFQDGVPDAVVTSTAVQSASPGDPADTVVAAGTVVAQAAEVPPVQPPMRGDGPERRLRRRGEGLPAPAARVRHRRRHAPGPASARGAALA